jgi:hypothetical protein
VPCPRRPIRPDTRDKGPGLDQAIFSYLQVGPPGMRLCIFEATANSDFSRLSKVLNKCRNPINATERCQLTINSGSCNLPLL